jgi:flagellar hook protein FlgE
LYSSVAGLDTTSTAISVIGDNIANVNTTGFKERRAEFADVLGQSITAASGFSSIGAGSKLNRVSTIFGQGTFESTGRATDLAIQGQGFFILDGVNGRNYSRAGVFDIDSQGTLVNPSGLRVQGFGIDPTTNLPNGQLGDITISSAFSPPNPTANYELSLNLDPNASTTVGPYDPANPSSTTNYSTSATFYDSLGSEHFATLRFNRTGAGTWDWAAVVDAADTTLAPLPGASEVVQGGGSLTFDSAGQLTGASGSPVTFEFAGGASPSQVVNIDFGPVLGSGVPVTTSYSATESTVNSFSQDGYAAGTLQSIGVGADGIVTGSFSNGETRGLAQVALASFANVEGLTSIGGNNLQESRQSGQALIGGPATGSFGTVRASSLEQSTVDLAAQFVRLIVNQRAFQANTRTVSVTNELLANLVSLGQ